MRPIPKSPVPRSPFLFSLFLLLGLSLSSYAHAKQPEEGDGAETPTEEAANSDGEDASETATEAPEETDQEAEDLQALRAEYFKLRDRLFQSRARASAVASAMYSTRMSVQLHYSSGRHFTVTRTTIRLDGANIYDDSEGTIASDKATRFEGYVAPGRHQLSIRIEATGKDDDRFASVIENSFTVQAVKGKDLIVKATAKDDGDMAYNWSKKESGSYKLHLDVSIKSAKRGKKKGEHIRRTGKIHKRAVTDQSRG